jgi:hypothetical protein
MRVLRWVAALGLLAGIALAGGAGVAQDVDPCLDQCAEAADACYEGCAELDDPNACYEQCDAQVQACEGACYGE